MPVLPLRSHDRTPIRVACAGDSITQGIGLAVPYPDALSQLVGPRFDVRNFGRSGATVQTNIRRDDWDRGFSLNIEHTRALAFEPDIVILNLGINDLNSESFDRARFEREYGSLIEAYTTLPSDPTICVWTPLAPLFPDRPFYGSPQVGEINEAIRVVASRTGATAIDMSTSLSDHPEWFPDHLHPNDAGAAAIAQRTYDALRELGLPVGAMTEETP